MKTDIKYYFCLTQQYAYFNQHPLIHTFLTCRIKDCSINFLCGKLLKQKIQYHLSWTFSSLSAWCKSGTRTSKPWDPGPRPPTKFKSGTRDLPLKFESGTQGALSKFKSGTLTITFLHCWTYFVLDKYMHNMEISFHEQSVF